MLRKAALLAGLMVGVVGGSGIASAQASIGIRIGNVAVGYSDYGYYHPVHRVYYHPYRPAYVVEEPVAIYHPYRRRFYREYVPFHRHW